MTRRLLVAAMAVYLLVVGLITLTPSTGDGHSPMWYVMRFLHRFGTTWVTESGLELVANVVLFVPFGLLGVPLVGRRRWWWVVVGGVLLTCAIETAQLGIPGRVSDVRDLVANTTGAIVGTAAALVAGGIRRGRSLGSVA